VFTDVGYVADAELLRRAMETAAALGHLVIASGSVVELARSGVIREGAVSTRLGLQGIPAAAESIAVARHIELARLTGARTHLGAISTARAVALVEGAQREGLPVSAHVQPWHLLLDEEAHLRRPYDTALRLEPPLPTSACRAALVDGVRRGVLAIGSGHRPVGAIGKDVEMALAEPGAHGLALALPLLARRAPEGGGADADLGIDVGALAAAMSALPAKVLGLEDAGRIVEGARGDLVVVDPGAGDAVDALVGRRAPTNPFAGERTSARVRATIAGGRGLYPAPRGASSVERAPGSASTSTS